MARGDIAGQRWHLLDRVGSGFMQFAACGNAGGRYYRKAPLFRELLASGDRSMCARCVRALVKRDRAFQRKARRQLRARARLELSWNFLDKTADLLTSWTSHHAIEAEEGAALGRDVAPPRASG